MHIGWLRKCNFKLHYESLCIYKKGVTGSTSTFKCMCININMVLRQKKIGEGFNLHSIDNAQGDLKENASTCNFVQGEHPQKHTWIIV